MSCNKPLTQTTCSSSGQDDSATINQLTSGPCFRHY